LKNVRAGNYHINVLLPGFVTGKENSFIQKLVSKLQGLSAEGAKCNSPGQRPGLGGPMKFWSAESAKWEIVDKTEVIMCDQQITRFQRWGIFQRLLPGPMAQAITFRAFGAKGIEF
jgi:hypothetical protein